METFEIVLKKVKKTIVFLLVCFYNKLQLFCSFLIYKFGLIRRIKKLVVLKLPALPKKYFLELSDELI